MLAVAQKLGLLFGAPGSSCTFTLLSVVTFTMTGLAGLGFAFVGLGFGLDVVDVFALGTFTFGALTTTVDTVVDGGTVRVRGTTLVVVTVGTGDEVGVGVTVTVTAGVGVTEGVTVVVGPARGVFLCRLAEILQEPATTIIAATKHATTASAALPVSRKSSQARVVRKAPTTKAVRTHP